MILGSDAALPTRQAALADWRPRPRRSSDHLAVREPDDVVAPQLQLHVPGAVALERRAAAMEAVPIGLDDQRPISPEEVDDERTDPGVHLGRRKAMTAAEPQEAPLELAAGEVGRRASCSPIVKSAGPRPGESPLRTLRRHRDAAQVGQRAGGVVTGMPLRSGRRRQESMMGERCTAMPRRLRRPPVPGTVTSIGPPGAGREPHKLRGAAVAECRALAAGEHSRHPSPLLAQSWVTDRVDAAVNAVQPARPRRAAQTPRRSTPAAAN